jgi:hypothetical protein
VLGICCLAAGVVYTHYLATGPHAVTLISGIKMRMGKIEGSELHSSNVHGIFHHPNFLINLIWIYYFRFKVSELHFFK